MITVPLRSMYAGLCLLFAAHSADARGGHSSSGYSHSGSHAHASHQAHHSDDHHKAVDVPRDAHGKIRRSAKAKDVFKRQHPCPSTGKSHGSCPGYIIDHIRPLKRGGADDPSNMQWQTEADAKAKDKLE